MKLEQSRWTDAEGWSATSPSALATTAQLVLVFGGTDVLKRGELSQTLRARYTSAHLMGCSTAGEICGTQVTDDSIVATAIEFEHSQVRAVRTRIRSADDSHAAGTRLANELPADRLVHLFVLADGVKVNGADLVKGLTATLPSHVSVTGGMAGDGARFAETLVYWHGTPEGDTVVALGLYGERLNVGFGSLGGWDPFGPQRRITRSKGNVLYELDGQSALQLYKTYLGEHARDLPASGLLFPLSIRTLDEDVPVVRAILAIDEAEQSVTFAGNIPEGARAQLMRANFDRLIDGATGAARRSQQPAGNGSAELAILISCVGRKLVLKQRIEEEIDAVRDVLGTGTMLAGFYSYGEISPFTPNAPCELHNQTMTITTLSERM